MTKKLQTIDSSYSSNGKKFLSITKFNSEYSLSPQNFGKKLASEWTKEYKRVIDEFLKQNNAMPRRKSSQKKDRTTKPLTK